MSDEPPVRCGEPEAMIALGAVGLALMGLAGLGVMAVVWVVEWWVFRR